MKLFVVFYDDFSGIDKMFFKKDIAELYKKWVGSIPDVQEIEVNEDFEKMIKAQQKQDSVK